MASRGLDLDQAPAIGPRDRIPSLTYLLPNGASMGLPLYRSWSYQFPHLSPGSPREVSFPEHIANRLFLRALQRWAARAGHRDTGELTLWATITCYSMDGQEHKAKFRWGVNPFSQGEFSPIIVYCNCKELPLLAKAPEPPIV